MSIPSALQTGAKYGMHTLNQSLADSVQDGSISYEMAREKASDLAEQLLGRAPTIQRLSTRSRPAVKRANWSSPR